MSSATIPLPWQARALATPPGWSLFLGGGRGGGKSTCACLVVIQAFVRNPDTARWIWVQASHGASGDAEDLFEELAIIAFGAHRVRRNRASRTISLDTGASIEFGVIDAGSMAKYSGRNFSGIVADEVGSAPSLKPIERLQACLRIPGIEGRVIYLANPGSTQHTTLARKFVNGRVPFAPYEIDGETWVTCPSVYTENTHLDQARYARRLLASVGNDRALGASYLDGDWNAISGAAFSDCYGPWLLFDNEEWKPPPPRPATPPTRSLADVFGFHAPPDATPRNDLRSWISLDWGYSAPSAVLFCVQTLVGGVVGPHGKKLPARSIVVVDELVTCEDDDLNVGLGWPPGKLAEEILVRCERWNCRPVGVGDDARSLDGSTLLEQFQKFGIQLERPQKDRVSGWIALRQLAASTRDDDPDRPHLLLSARCKYLHATMPTQPRDPLRPEDISSKGPDHALDACRYSVAYASRLPYGTQATRALIY